MQDLLSRKDSTDSDNFDLLDEPNDNKKFLLTVFALVIVVAIGFSAYYFAVHAPQQRQEKARQAVLRTPILAPAGPLKEIPENTGGLQIPNQDKQVFETIESKPETETSDTQTSEAQTDEAQTDEAQTDEAQTDDVAENQDGESPTAVLPAAEQPQSPPTAEVTETAEAPAPEASPESSPETSSESTPEPSPETPPEVTQETETETEETVASIEPADDGKLQIIIPTEPSPEPSPEASPEPSPTVEVTEPAAEVSAEVSAVEETTDEVAEEVAEEAESVGGRLEIRIPTAEEAAAAAAAASDEAPVPEAPETTETVETAEAEIPAEASSEASPDESAPEESTPEESPNESSAPSEAVAETGDFIAQMAALQRRASAETVRDDLLRRFAQVFSADRLLVESGQASDGSEIFRVQTVPLGLSEAQSICATLQQNGLNCFVRRKP